MKIKKRKIRSDVNEMEERKEEKITKKRRGRKRKTRGRKSEEIKT